MLVRERQLVLREGNVFSGFFFVQFVTTVGHLLQVEDN